MSIPYMLLDDWPARLGLAEIGEFEDDSSSSFIIPIDLFPATIHLCLDEISTRRRRKTSKTTFYDMASMSKVFEGYAARKAVLDASTNQLSKGIAWVAGELAPLSEAKVPLMDQGFLRSDLTYDVPAVWDGRFFRLDEHMARLEASCAKLRMQLPLGREEVKRILVYMVAKSGIRDAYVELIVTRGLRSVRGTQGTDHKNHLYLFVQPYVWVVDPEAQRVGASAIIARTGKRLGAKKCKIKGPGKRLIYCCVVRRTPPGAMDPTVKYVFSPKTKCKS
jgi:hypothetical protein